LTRINKDSKNIENYQERSDLRKEFLQRILRLFVVGYIEQPLPQLVERELPPLTKCPE
jgi:hypothetical protein